ncbi:MAG: hypothetical protein ACRCYQ_03495, partial [Nocardioides sp.]
MKRLLVLSAAGVLIAVGASQAQALAAGTYSQRLGNSATSQTWSVSARTVTLTVTPSARDVGTDTDGRCVDSAFDWRVSDGGHYDARIVRVCDGSGLKSWTFTERGTAPLTGEGRARGCLVTGTAADGTGGKVTGCSVTVGTGVPTCGSYAVSCVVLLRGTWTTYPATN